MLKILLRECKDKLQTEEKYLRIMYLTKDLRIKYTRNSQNSVTRKQLNFKKRGSGEKYVQILHQKVTQVVKKMHKKMLNIICIRKSQIKI